MNTDLLREGLINTEIEILDEFKRVCDQCNLKWVIYDGTLLGAVRHKGFIPWDDDIDVAMPREDYEKLCTLEEQGIFDEKFEFQYYKNSDITASIHGKLVKKKTILQMKGETVEESIFIDVFPLDHLKKNQFKLYISKKKIVNFITGFVHCRIRGNEYSRTQKILYPILNLFSNEKLLKLREGMIRGTGEYLDDYTSYTEKPEQLILETQYFPATTLEFEGKEYPAPNDYDAILTSMYGDYMQIPDEKDRVTHNPIKIVLDTTECR